MGALKSRLKATWSDGDYGVVAEKLEDEGIISSDLLFRVLVALQGYEDKLVAGDYEFEKGMPTLEVLERIRSGQTAPLVVTIREGLRAEEIAELMEDKTVLSAEDFLEAIEIWYEFSFLYTKPYWATLEGYLFPDTYFFSRNMTAEEVVLQILENFDERVDDPWNRAEQRDDDLRTPVRHLAPGKQVAGEGFCHEHQENQHADEPDQFARFLVRAVKHRAEHVQVDDDEEERRPRGMHVSNEPAPLDVAHDVLD